MTSKITGANLIGGTESRRAVPGDDGSVHTSVGRPAIRRFLRPVAWQNAPDALLPEALRDVNPLKVQRLIDGTWTRAAMQTRD